MAVDLRPHLHDFFRREGLSDASYAVKAERLGVSPGFLHTYLTDPGKTMKQEYFEKLLHLVGGDIQRALPGYSADEGIARLEQLKRETERVAEEAADYESGEAVWLGGVVGDSGIIRPPDQERDERYDQRTLDAIAGESTSYGETAGRVRLLKVRGDIDHELTDGTTLLVREVAEGVTPRGGALVVVQPRAAGEPSMLCRLVSRREGWIAGPVIFRSVDDTWDDRTARLTHVVVGKIRP